MPILRDPGPDHTQANQRCTAGHLRFGQVLGAILHQRKQYRAAQAVLIGRHLPPTSRQLASAAGRKMQAILAFPGRNQVPAANRNTCKLPQGID